jgi:hypothetical protein
MKSHQPIVINRPVKNKPKLENDQSVTNESQTNGKVKKVKKVRGGCCLRGKRS